MKKLTTLLTAFLLLSFASEAQNIGIGTTNPQHKLHVSGGDLFVSTSTGGFRTGFDGSNQWKISSTGGGANLLWTTSADGTSFSTRHYWGQDGDVSIGGSIAPNARLEVNSGSNSSANNAFRIRAGNGAEILKVRDDGRTAYAHGGSLGRTHNFGGTGINLYLDDATFAGAITPGTAGHLQVFSTFASGVLDLQPVTGVVTIGTTTPAAGYILSVDGRAIMEEVKVQVSGAWPDYVFDKDYKLMSLEDLRASLKKNGHLPNIPSAKQVNNDNGIELGEMNKKLLEKIEELTLYILELDTKVKALEEKTKQK